MVGAVGLALMVVVAVVLMVECTVVKAVVRL